MQHRIAKRWLSEQEIHDFLLLGAATFIVLPLLPDRTLDPWQSLNPRRLWLLVVAVMSIASAGHLALRIFGARFGLAMSGLAGGFASSTATVAVMAERAREAPDLAPVAASAAVVSNVGTIVQLGVVVGALAMPLLERLAAALIVAGIVAVLAAVVADLRAKAISGDAWKLAGTRPFKPMAILRFVALLAGILLVTALVRTYVGYETFPWLMALSGLADVHAAAASAAQAVAGGQIDTNLGAWSVLVAFTANASLKCALASAKGGRAFAIRVVPGIVAVVIAFATAVAATV